MEPTIETCKSCGSFVFNDDCTKCARCGLTRQAYILKSQLSLNEGKEEERPTEEYLIKSGWIKRPAPAIIGVSYALDIGRNRRLIFSNIDNPNQMLIIAEVDPDNNCPTDMVVLHNWDYDKWISTQRFENIINILNNKDIL